MGEKQRSTLQSGQEISSHLDHDNNPGKDKHQFYEYISSALDERKKRLKRVKEPATSRSIIEFDKGVESAIWTLRDTDKYIAAQGLIDWVNGTDVDKKSEVTDEFIKEVLPKFIGREAYDHVGLLLVHYLKDREPCSLEYIIDSEGEDSIVQTIPYGVLQGILANYVRTGFLEITKKGNLKFTKAGKNEPIPLRFASIENVDSALSALTVADETESDLISIYATSREKAKVESIDIATKNRFAKVLYMSELLIGNRFSDVEFFSEVVERVKRLSDEQKPDAVVLSGLLQGDFKYWQKNRRVTLDPALSSMDEQFKRAKEMVDLVRETGATVIYNMGDDDRRIAREYTVEVFKKMLQLADPMSLQWDKIDRMERHPSWNTHLQFQIDVVFPYCLRSGRRLHTANEMSELTNGEVELEEYFMLFEVYNQILTGVEVNASYAKWLNLDNLPTPENKTEQNFAITDDANLVLAHKSSTYNINVRHNMGFTATSYPKNHLRPSLETVQQLQANGRAVPDMLVTQHAHEAVMVNVDDSWVVSTPGFINTESFVNTKASITDAPGDIARRLVTQRGNMTSPGATMHELGPNNVHRVTFFNKRLIEKADSLPERTAVVLFNDWQTGSPTSRPDLQAQLMDMVYSKVLPNKPVHLFVNGDIMHGRNYPNFPSESERIGLISMQSQEQFVKELMTRAASDLSAGDLQNLKHVGITPGNHEWNSGTQKIHGYNFTSYIFDLFDDLYRSKGIMPKVKLHEAIQTPQGEHFRSHTAFEPVGAYGVMVQHMPLDKSAKGAISGPPVYQFEKLMKGVGKLAQGIDVGASGHWHHPQAAMFGDKLFTVSGSMAGISEFEWMRAYRAVIGAGIIHLGGGLPPTIEFLSRQAIAEHKIQTGYFSKKNLRSEGYKDDKNFDPAKHGVFTPRAPKSALQKVIRYLIEEVKESAETTSHLV